MNKYLIYGLYCPFTDNLHYVGQSRTAMTRPMQHLTEYTSQKIYEWVSQLKFLGYKPVIKILEECNEKNINEREKFWIKKSKEEGSYLLNITYNHTKNILLQKEYEFGDADIMAISQIIRETRKERNILQEELCQAAGITRPTLHMIEKGNSQTIYNNLRKVLDVLGFEITIKKKS